MAYTEAQAPSSPWWEESNPATLLGGSIDYLMQSAGELARIDRYEKHYQLYGGRRLQGIRPWDGPADQSTVALESANVDKLRFNVCKAATDTVTSKVGKLRPRPTFLTDGGNWTLQLRAKRLQKFMDGAYHQSDLFEHAPDVFRDAMLFGTGILHPHKRGKRLASERVRPWELFVDPADAMYGTPRVLYRVKWLAVSQAVAMYGAKAAAAQVDPTTKPRDDTYFHPGYVRCVEAWALPLDPEPTQREGKRDGRSKLNADKYGRHTVQCGDVVVLDEDYPWVEFPFVFVHWTKPVQGFWGDAALQEVVGIQVEINTLIQLIQQSMRRVGQPVFLKREGAILKPKEMTNEVGLEIEVGGDLGAGSLEQAVKAVTFQPIHPQIVDHVWQLWAKAFEILGSNQLAASATAPVGLESGRALEALAEEHSERFMTVSRHFEHCLGELCARQFLRLAKELDQELEGGYVIRTPGTKHSLRIKWSEVQMDEDAFLIQVFPTSVLPTTPAARIKEVERLASAGWIDPTEARRLLDFPDLKQGTDLAVADSDNLLFQLEQMLEDGKSLVPEPYQDLAKAQKWATASILRAKADGVPDKNIARVRDFVTACEAMMARAAESAQQAAPAADAAGQQAAAAAGGGLPAPGPVAPEMASMATA